MNSALLGGMELKIVSIDRVQVSPVKGRVGLEQGEVLGASTGCSNFQFLVSHMAPGGLGRMHSHAESEHFLMVLSGQLEVRGEGQKAEIGPLTVAYFPPGEAHEIHNPGPGATKYVVFYAPRE